MRSRSNGCEPGTIMSSPPARAALKTVPVITPASVPDHSGAERLTALGHGYIREG